VDGVAQVAGQTDRSPAGDAVEGVGGESGRVEFAVAHQKEVPARAREEVERSTRPRRTLCAVLRGEHDWERGERAPDGVDTGDLMSL
jgi:hypothetical protein